jgi:hypothetical protein
MKAWIRAFLISCLLTLCGMFVNYRSYAANNHLKWKYDIPGGECLNEVGFGLSAFHTYGITPDQADTHKLSFDVINFVLTLVIVTLMIRAADYIIVKIMKKYMTREL